MQLQSKKNTLAVLLVGWLIVLGSYLIIRFVFILIGFTLNPTILGICLAVIPCLLETLYLGKCGKSQRISVYVLGLLIPSIVEKVALYLIGAFLCGIDPANIAGVMEAAASREPFVNLFTQPSARYVINISFFNWAYIVCGILFSALCCLSIKGAESYSRIIESYGGKRTCVKLDVYYALFAKTKTLKIKKHSNER